MPFSWPPRLEEGSFSGEDSSFEGVRLSYGSICSSNIKDTQFALVGSLKVNIIPTGLGIVLLSIIYLIYSYWALDHHIYLVYALLLQHYGLFTHSCMIKLDINIFRL